MFFLIKYVEGKIGLTCSYNSTRGNNVICARTQLGRVRVFRMSEVRLLEMTYETVGVQIVLILKHFIL